MQLFHPISTFKWNRGDWEKIETGGNNTLSDQLLKNALDNLQKEGKNRMAHLEHHQYKLLCKQSEIRKTMAWIFLSNKR